MEDYSVTQMDKYVLLETERLCKTAKEIYPTLKSEIDGFLDLLSREIQQGKSIKRECSLCVRDVNELINKYKLKQNKIMVLDEKETAVKKPYTKPFELEKLDFSGLGIEFKDLSKEDVRSLETRNRTSILELKDHNDVNKTRKGRLYARKVDGQYKVMPDYVNTTDLIIKDNIGGTNISEKDRKDLLNGKYLKREDFVDNDTKANYTAYLCIDKELNKVLIVPEKKIPKEFLHAKLDEKQQEALLSGKEFFLIALNKEGKKMGVHVKHDIQTNNTKFRFPEKKVITAKIEEQELERLNDIKANRPGKEVVVEKQEETKSSAVHAYASKNDVGETVTDIKTKPAQIKDGKITKDEQEVKEVSEIKPEEIRPRKLATKIKTPAQEKEEEIKSEEKRNRIKF